MTGDWQIPEFTSLTMPQGNRGSLRTIARAKATADAAGPHASVFTETGLPAGFLAQLSAAANALEVSLGDKTRQRGVG